jgi:aminoglycoside phosphotransferase (APT) family kinase protein
MAREARIQRALAPTPVPVPRILLLEHEALTLDVPFYVMEKVPGLVLRDELPKGYAGAPADKEALAGVLVDTLAALHEVDPATVGLSDYGRQDFVLRQVRTWTRQWEASKSREVVAMDELSARLSRHRWTQPPRVSVVHGDYRIDNCLFDACDPGRLRAVLDWELSTLGDPLTDLGMLLYYWCHPGEPAPALTPALTATPGFPERHRVAELYANASGRDLSDLQSYVALAHFKFAAIAQGVAARVEAGQMAGQDFGNLDAEVQRIAEAGLRALTD